MDSQLIARIEAILHSHNFSALLPISFLGSKPGCSIWSSRLYANYGDADCQLLVFDFLNDPAVIVDYEEELLGIESNSQTVSLVTVIRTERIGVLITSSTNDIGIFEQFKKEPEAETTVAYHPQLNRLLGGDYFHQLKDSKDVWLKATLASVPKAKRLNELLSKAIGFYHAEPEWRGKLKDPLPRILAILQIPEIEIPGAPPEYKELALIQSIITHPACIEEPATLQYVNWNVFSRQVFGFLRSQHKHGICYSSFAGCCLRPEFLCPDGSLTDAYFIDNPGNMQAFRQQAKTDLGNFLLVLRGAGIDTALCREAIVTGVEQYIGATTAADLIALIYLVVREDFDHSNTRAGALATEMINFNDSFYRG